MNRTRKLLAAGGLALVVGPFCLQVLAQGYVDLEAERAAREAAGVSGSAPPPDPYDVKPAQSYPAASYGVAGAAAAPAAVPATPPAGGNQNLGNLFLQIQQMQQEIMRLNGKVEEQAYEISQLKEQSLQRYMDLDKRISGGAATSPGPSPSAAPGPSVAPESEAVEMSPAGTGSTAVVEKPGEAEAYRAAYALVQGRQFEQAVPAFRDFLRDYPSGKYAANAHYWLGELYLVMDPPDLESSRQSFALLISQYPDNPKAPDALYKLGKVQFMKGNRERAREYLDLVISQYSGTNSAVVKLAQDFIAENY